MKFLFLIFSGVFAVLNPNISAAQSELFYQTKLCGNLKLNVYHSPSRTYVDCLSETHAIEVDFSGKWHEAIGQSLHYANVFERKPGIILVCEANDDEHNCTRHSYLAEQTLARWGIAADLWLCKSNAFNLKMCSFVSIEP